MVGPPGIEKRSLYERIPMGIETSPPQGADDGFRQSTNVSLWELKHFDDRIVAYGVKYERIPMGIETEKYAKKAKKLEVRTYPYGN